MREVNERPVVSTGSSSSTSTSHAHNGNRVLDGRRISSGVDESRCCVRKVITPDRSTPSFNPPPPHPLCISYCATVLCNARPRSRFEWGMEGATVCRADKSVKTIWLTSRPYVTVCRSIDRSMRYAVHTCPYLSDTRAYHRVSWKDLSVGVVQSLWKSIRIDISIASARREIEEFFRRF